MKRLQVAESLVIALCMAAPAWARNPCHPTGPGVFADQITKAVPAHSQAENAWLPCGRVS